MYPRWTKSFKMRQNWNDFTQQKKTKVEKKHTKSQWKWSYHFFPTFKQRLFSILFIWSYDKGAKLHQQMKYNNLSSWRYFAISTSIQIYLPLKKPFHHSFLGKNSPCCSRILLYIWLVVSTHLKNMISQIGSIFPKFRGENKKSLSCHTPRYKKSCRVPGGSSSSINRSLHCLHPEKWLNSRSPAERQKRRSPWCMPVIETTHCPASRAHHQTCRPWERRKYLDFKTLEGDCENSIC